MEDVRMLVPTYYYSWRPQEVESHKIPEYGTPEVPVLIREAEGVRIVLGTHDFEDMTKPDVQIERQPNGWMIFLHPEGGGDPSGAVYFHDDGRSFVKPEIGSGGIEWLDSCQPVPGFEKPK